VTKRRSGYTLLEVIAILAVLIILAVILIPSMTSIRNDTRQRAGFDSVQAELALARARAKEENKPYRVAVNGDGTRIRRAPDDTNFATAAAADMPSGSSIVVDYAFDSVTVSVLPETNNPVPPSNDGWTTIGTVQPDGTCREDTTLLVIRDGDQTPLYARLRGLTASLRVAPAPTNGAAPGGAP
jgi:type II secretory pathway pseudopilin PulG